MQTKAVSDTELVGVMAEGIFHARIGPEGRWSLLTRPQQQQFRSEARAALKAKRVLLGRRPAELMNRRCQK